MDRVVSEEVHEIIDIHERVVNGHNLSLVGVLGEGRAESESTNSSESVDSKSDCAHSIFVRFSFIY